METLVDGNVMTFLKEIIRQIAETGYPPYWRYWSNFVAGSTLLNVETSTLLYWISLSSFLLCSSRPSGWKHRHTVPDQQSRARQDSQTVDQTLRHIDQHDSSRTPHPPHTHTHTHTHTHSSSPPKSMEAHPLLSSTLPPPQRNELLFVPCWLEKLLFYTKSLLGLYFPIHWMLIWSWKALILLLFLSLLFLLLLHCL